MSAPAQGLAPEANEILADFKDPVDPPVGGVTTEVVAPSKSFVPIAAAPVSPDSNVRRVDGEAADAGVESATNPVKANDEIASKEYSFFLNALPVVCNFIVNSSHIKVCESANSFGTAFIEY